MPSYEKFTRPRDLWERRWGDLRRIASWRAVRPSVDFWKRLISSLFRFKKRIDDDDDETRFVPMRTRHAYQC